MFFFFVVCAIWKGVDVTSVRPYIVSINGCKTGFFRNYISCTGVIVSNTKIIIPAHCIYGFNYLRIYFGLLRAEKKDESALYMNVYENIFIHPSYNDKAQGHDIAVIVLSKPLPFGDFISEIEMVDQNYTDKYDLKDVEIYGFGGNKKYISKN